jgi:hypothetical protein
MPHAAPPRLLVPGVAAATLSGRCSEETTMASSCACCSKEVAMPMLAVLARHAAMAMVSWENVAGVFLHDATIEYFYCYFWSIFLYH